MRFILACFSIGVLIGCTGPRVYQMAVVQAELGRSVQTADTMIQKSATELAERRSLLESLGRAVGARDALVGVESSLRAQLALMDAAVGVMSARRKSLVAANGTIAAMGYTHSEIRAPTPEYDSVDAAVADFREAARDVNAAAGDFSRASKAFWDIVTAKKLYSVVDVADFVGSLQKAIVAARARSEVMREELARLSAGVAGGRSSGPGDARLEELNQLAVDYARGAGTLAGIARLAQDAALGMARVSNIDPTWPAVQTCLAEFDRVRAELATKSAAFDRLAAQLRRQG